MVTKDINFLVNINTRYVPKHKDKCQKSIYIELSKPRIDYRLSKPFKLSQTI